MFKVHYKGLSDNATLLKMLTKGHNPNKILHYSYLCLFSDWGHDGNYEL